MIGPLFDSEGQKRTGMSQFWLQFIFFVRGREERRRKEREAPNKNKRVKAHCAHINTPIDPWLGRVCPFFIFGSMAMCNYAEQPLAIREG